MSNDVVEAIAAWQRREIDEVDLWRRLLVFDGWQVPLDPASDADPFARFTIGSALLVRAPAGPQLAIFSGPDAIEASTGKSYGSDGIGYANPRGWEILGADLSSLAAVVVDPGSPHALSAGADRLGEIAALARAVEVEAAWARLRQGREEDGDLVLVARYGGYWVAAVERAQGMAMIHVPHDDGGMFVAIFTHADALARALPAFEEGFPGDTIRTVEVAGDKVFPLIAKEAADGLVVNYRGPPEPVAFRLEAVQLLMDALSKPN